MYRSKQDLRNFIDCLPRTLKNELSLIMHKDLIQKIPFLQNKDEYFLAFCAPMFKAIKFHENQYIYEKGSPLDEIYFVVGGTFGLVLTEF